MAEWLKAHAWKACIRETVSRVRIPLSPPYFQQVRESAVQVTVLGDGACFGAALHLHHRSANSLCALPPSSKARKFSASKSCSDTMNRALPHAAHTLIFAVTSTRRRRNPEWQGKPETMKSASWPPATRGLASRDSLAGWFDFHPAPIFPMRPKPPIHQRQWCLRHRGQSQDGVGSETLLPEAGHRHRHRGRFDPSSAAPQRAHDSGLPTSALGPPRCLQART
jgi:hypothetical protein